MVCPFLSNCLLAPVLFLCALFCNNEVGTLKTTFEHHQLLLSGFPMWSPEGNWKPGGRERDTSLPVSFLFLLVTPYLLCQKGSIFPSC